MKRLKKKRKGKKEDNGRKRKKLSGTNEVRYPTELL